MYVLKTLILLERNNPCNTLDKVLHQQRDFCVVFAKVRTRYSIVYHTWLFDKTLGFVRFGFEK